MRTKKLATMALVTASISACIPNAPTPQSPRFYETAVFVDDIGGDFAGVLSDISVSNPPSSSAPTLLSLPPAALSKVIEVYGEDNSMRPNLPKLLTATLSNSSSSSRRDTTGVRTRKKLTLSIAPLNFHPSDRIVESTITLKLSDSNWKIRGWQGFKDLSRNLKLASLSNSEKQKFTAGLTAPFTIDNNAGSGSLGIENINESSSNRDLGIEVVEFLPILTNNEAKISLNAPFQQINVAGNYEVVLSLEYDSREAKRQDYVHFASAGNGDSALERRLIEFVPRDKFVALDVNGKFTHRLRQVYNPTAPELNISNGSATAIEDDDRATYKLVSFNVPQRRMLSATELRKDLVVAIIRSTAAGYEGGGRPAHFRRAGDLPGSSTCLMFSDGMQAREFLDWFSQSPGSRTRFPQTGSYSWQLYYKNDSGNLLQLDGLQLDNYPFEFVSISLNSGTPPENLEDCFQL